jgi:hypothetical protein
MRVSALPLYDGISPRRYGFFRSLRLVAAEVSSVRAISEGRVRDGDQRTPNNLCFAVLSFA